VTVGASRGTIPSANLLRLVSKKITVMGSIMGTLEEMHNMIADPDKGFRPSSCDPPAKFPTGFTSAA
jgi:hypothetical protein